MAQCPFLLSFLRLQQIRLFFFQVLLNSLVPLVCLKLASYFLHELLELAVVMILLQQPLVSIYQVVEHDFVNAWHIHQVHVQTFDVSQRVKVFFFFLRLLLFLLFLFALIHAFPLMCLAASVFKLFKSSIQFLNALNDQWQVRMLCK